MKEDFLIKIETWHKPDLGTQENVSSTSREPKDFQAAGWGLEALPRSESFPVMGPSLWSCFNSLFLDPSYQHGIALSLICKT